VLTSPNGLTGLRPARSDRLERLRGALGGPDCALCAVAADEDAAWLSACLRAPSPQHLAVLEAAWLCEDHGARLGELASAGRVSAQAAEALLAELRSRALARAEAALERLAAGASAPWPARWLRRLIGPDVLRRSGLLPARAPLLPLQCPACAAEAACEAALSAALAAALDKATWREALDTAALLCRRHLAQVLRGANPETARWLSGRYDERLGELRAELREFLRKSDWNNRLEPRGREHDSWLRATRFLGGARRLARRERPES
jgi:hypothetical protein